jgi:uncharacterized membrane protein
MREWASPYSFWIYLLLAGGIAVLLAIAYRTATSDRLRTWWLFVPRLLVLGLLLAILLNPVHRSEQRLPEQPGQVHFLVDASRSMALEQPQSRMLQAQQSIATAYQSLSAIDNPPRVQMYRFGNQLSSVSNPGELKPTDNTTLLADALEQLPSRFSRDLPRGVVVFSDGMVDDGKRLEEVSRVYRELGVPIHVFPVGDSKVLGDVAIDDLVVPPRVDPGVRAPIRGVVRGTGFEGKRIVLEVRSENNPSLPPLATLPITLSDSPQAFEMLVEAKPEYRELVLQAAPLEGEASTQNNRIPFQLVKSDRILRVLYMEGSPGNEFTFIRDALIEDKDIECVSMVVDQQYVQRPRLMRVDDSYRGFPTTREELFKFDCVICSDISIGAFTKEQLEWTVELVEKRGGGFAMVGGHTSFGAGGWDQTAWDQLIPVDMRGGKLGSGWVDHRFKVSVPTEELSHPIWKIVDDPEENKLAIRSIPPFLGTNYMQRLKPAATVLAVSADSIPQVGMMPIFACQPYGRGRTFAFAPDSTAAWGSYFETVWGKGDNRYFRRFWRNVIRWLTENSVGGTKRLLFETDRVIYREGQPIQITAYAYDASLKATTQYDVYSAIKSSRQTKSTDEVPAVALRPQSTTYSGTIDRESWNAIHDEAEASVIKPVEIELIALEKGKEIARATTRVMVLPDLHELVQPRADKETLENLAKSTGGTSLRSVPELTELLSKLKSIPGEAVVSRQPLWDTTWMWILLVALLSIEWIMRRRSTFA